MGTSKAIKEKGTRQMALGPVELRQNGIGFFQKFPDNWRRSAPAGQSGLATHTPYGSPNYSARFCEGVPLSTGLTNVKPAADSRILVQMQCPTRLCTTQGVDQVLGAAFMDGRRLQLFSGGLSLASNPRRDHRGLLGLQRCLRVLPGISLGNRDRCGTASCRCCEAFAWRGWLAPT
jgi:hypothetical protein